MSSCPFCDIIQGRAPAKVRRCEPDAWWIVPLNPVTHGHTLVIPTVHVPNALADPAVAARTMELAARWADYPCNLITSCGPDATQTVYHLHIHIVPRRRGDGLALPWTGQSVTAPSRSLAGGQPAGAEFQRSRLAPGGESGQKAPAVPVASLSGWEPSDQDPSYRPGVTPDGAFVDLAAAPRAHQPHEAHPVHPHLGSDPVPGPAGLMGSHQQGPTFG